MTQLYDIGRSALSTYQAALSVVSRNVANVNTPGYARQSLQFGQMPDGAGVDILRLTRNTDLFAQASARDAIAERAGLDIRAQVLTRVDTQLSDPATGLAEPLRRLSETLSALTASPTDIAARQAVLSAADGVAAQVQGLDLFLAAEQGEASRRVGSLVREAQVELDELSRVQQQLDSAGPNSAGAATLLDQRDVLLEGLAEKLGARSTVQGDGSLQITLGNGQPLLLAGQPVRLGVGTDALNQPQVTLGGVIQPARVIGGEIRGVLDVLQTDLPSTRDALGRIAAGIAELMNSSQAAGAALDGGTAPAVFDMPQPRATAVGSNTGGAEFAAVVDSAADLPASRLLVSWNGTAWSATNPQGQAVPVAGSGAVGDPLRVGGMALTLTGTALSGDRFVLEPPLAGALRTTGIRADQLATAAAGSPPNSADNSQLLALNDALSGGLFDGGRTSLAEATNLWVSQTGETTAAMISRADVARASESFAVDRRDSIQGVNLDEEAADLLRFQQAYQAAAQVMATAGSLFDSVLSVIRR